MVSNPSVLSGDLPSDSQNEGERIRGGHTTYISWALRRKYIVKGFYVVVTFPVVAHGLKTKLTIPIFSSRLAAEKYHSAARRLACFRTLNKAACASNRAEADSSALGISIRYNTLANGAHLAYIASRPNKPSFALQNAVQKVRKTNANFPPHGIDESTDLGVCRKLGRCWVDARQGGRCVEGKHRRGG